MKVVKSFRLPLCEETEIELTKGAVLLGAEFGRGVLCKVENGDDTQPLKQSVCLTVVLDTEQANEKRKFIWSNNQVTYLDDSIKTEEIPYNWYPFFSVMGIPIYEIL